MKTVVALLSDGLSIVPAGCGLLIRPLNGVEDKNKAIIARFDIGEALLFFRRAGRSNRLEKASVE